MSDEWDMQTLLLNAISETGLEDFGEPDLAGGLALLMKSFNEDVKFSEFGRQAFRSRLQMHLCNRLRMVEDRKRMPGIASEKIEQPIFITGLPRSGSSFLLEVMAQDPANRTLMTWEILQPSPPPKKETYETDPRIERVRRLLEEQGYTDPDLLATHPFGATLPEECAFIMEQSFVSNNFGGVIDAKQYSDWMAMKADHGISYAFHRRFLQHLQYGFRRERWVLKAPEHLFYLGALLNEYPDARIVLTHRDLMKVLPSITSMAAALYNIFMDHSTVDPIGVGRTIINRLALGVRHTMAVRESLGRGDQFCDIRYSDLRADPVSTVELIYAHFDIPFTRQARAAMTHFVTTEGKARHGHGRHKYALDDFGFTELDIEREFSDYISTYRIPRES